MARDKIIHTEAPPKKKRSCFSTCLPPFLILSAIIIWTLWVMGAQGRRCHKAYKEVKQGMTIAEVEGLLAGRHWINYYVTKDGKEEFVEKEAFHKAFPVKADSPVTGGRIDIIFRGMTPLAFSFDVEFDAEGKVSNILKINSWD